MSGPTKLHAQSWPVIGQFSSIGSLGANKDVWVCGEWLESLSTTRGSASMPGPNRAQVHLVSVANASGRLLLVGSRSLAQTFWIYVCLKDTMF